jgi:hypothetical protein
MVVGVYGLLYLHAAWRLESAWPIIAVGLLGKILGPIGMAMSFSDDWPRRLGMLCVYNDLIWWLPFGLFLVRGTSVARWLERAAPWVCVISHIAASLVMAVFLRDGTLAQPEELHRAAYICEHTTIWCVGWLLWMASAASFVGLCAWWGSRLIEWRIATLAVVIASFGTVFDFSGEGISILVLVERAASAHSFDALPSNAWKPAPFTSAERCFTLLSAGAANLLYTVAGIMLTLLTVNVPRWVRVAMWITWAAGITMTVAGVANHVQGLVVSSYVLFPLFIVWTAWMGARWRGP